LPARAPENRGMSARRWAALTFFGDALLSAMVKPLEGQGNPPPGDTARRVHAASN
jgi:hypothetical protein